MTNPHSSSFSELEFRFFPHENFRPHQREGIESIFNSVKVGNILLLDSPTGTGKSAMVLCGVLEAMSNNEKLVVITRT
ncbi:MAG: hypothetical protein KKB24_03900, partial [Candidatus Altiarchaeota archaeon]|nr:hypothetical protein [Candidatus Altiarchaeota archaeon]